MSDTFNDSEPSSVFYMNQVKSNRSVKSKPKLSLMSSEKIDLKIRIVKSIVEFKNLLHQKFVTMEITLIVGFALCLLLQGVLFYFMYTAIPTCCKSCGTNNEPKFTPIDTDDETGTELEPNTREKGKKQKDDAWWWASQIYTKIDESSTRLLKKMDNMFQVMLNDVLSKIQDEVEYQTELTKGFYLTLKNAEEVEFEMPNKKNVKKTQEREQDDRTRVKHPVLPPRKPRPTSVWIGPTGMPGYAVRSYTG